MAMTRVPFQFAAIFAALLLVPACAGVPARGLVGGQTIETRVDSEAARYFLTNYLAGQRSDTALDGRIDHVYRSGDNGLPDRNRLKQLSDNFSVDFAALYFADRLARVPRNREFFRAFNRAFVYARKASSGEGASLPSSVYSYEFLFVPGYLYRRHPMTGADLAAPRATLEQFGFTQHFIQTAEDGAVEANAEIVAAAIRARAQARRRLILVSVSKSGAEVATALTTLGSERTRHVAAWINIAGVLQGSPLADEALLELEDILGQVDAAGVDSLGTQRSRERFSGFRIPSHVLVVNYIGIPLTGSVSRLAQSGFLRLRAYGPNDGVSLLSDLIVPDRLTLAELGRDHFLLDEQVDVSALALALTVIDRLEQSDGAARFRVDGAR